MHRGSKFATLFSCLPPSSSASLSSGLLGPSRQILIAGVVGQRGRFAAVAVGHPQRSVVPVVVAATVAAVAAA